MDKGLFSVKYMYFLPRSPVYRHTSPVRTDCDRDPPTLCLLSRQKFFCPQDKLHTNQCAALAIVE